MTEYQKSFMWKENVASKVDASSTAPVVNASVDNAIPQQQTVKVAQQPPAPIVVLNDQRPAAASSVAIQPTVAASTDFDVKSRTYVPVKKRDPINRTSEYKSNFVSYSKPKSQTTKKEEVKLLNLSRTSMQLALSFLLHFFFFRLSLSTMTAIMKRLNVKFYTFQIQISRLDHMVVT